MHVTDLILYIIAALCFLLAMLNVGSQRVNLIAAGLFAWVLVALIAVAQTIH